SSKRCVALAIALTIRRLLARTARRTVLDWLVPSANVSWPAKAGHPGDEERTRLRKISALPAKAIGRQLGGPLLVRHSFSDGGLRAVTKEFNM
ncbi:MAG TPA: hypothetical protein VGC27_00900, partial [Rhizomicrobium sp.]